MAIIAEKRPPQVFLFFAKYPDLLKQMAERVCTTEHEALSQLPECLQLLVRLYVLKYRFVINKHDRVTAQAVFEEIGSVVDVFSVTFQSTFQNLLHRQLVDEFRAHHKKEQKTNYYDYAVDVYRIKVDRKAVSEIDYMDEEVVLQYTLSMS